MKTARFGRLRHVVPVFALLTLTAVSHTVTAQTAAILEPSRQSLSELDRMIAEIESRVSLFSIPVIGAEQPPPTQTTQDAPKPQRAPTGPACFATFAQQIETPAELRALLEEAKAASTAANGNLAAFKAIQGTVAGGTCNATMKSILNDADTAMSTVSADQLSSLAQYLEKCWPGDIGLEEDAAIAEVDALHALSSELYWTTTSVGQQLYEAAQVCK
jgi:hypothetical protein